MSRTSLREKRLGLFKLGNTHCPICLTPFTEPDVRAGEVVTLEHAPQKSLGGKPACLTCVRCNTGPSTGMVDRAVADYFQAQDDGGYRITVEWGTGPYTINPKYYDIGKDDISIRVPSDEVWDGHGPFTLRWTEPWPDAIRLGLLKSAYLMVFSLLGKVAGYRYAQGEAVSSIRQQLLSPEKELARPLVFACDPANPQLPEHAVLLATEYQCWAVRIRDALVILPPGGSFDRYRRLAEAFGESPLTLRSTVRWPATKFGYTMQLVGGKPPTLKTRSLFGKSARYRTDPHQANQHGVVAYSDPDMVAVLPVSGPSGNPRRRT